MGKELILQNVQRAHRIIYEYNKFVRNLDLQLRNEMGIPNIHKYPRINSEYNYYYPTFIEFFFGFFFEGKLSGTLMDERYKENQLRARTTANRIALTIIFLAVLLLGQGKIMGNLELTLVAFVIVVVLALALELFLSSYLLYRYDHDEPADGDGE